jgi:hypothetical protein
MPEQFALEKSPRHRGAVQFYDLLCVARTEFVDRLPDELLACSGLSDKKNRDVRRSDGFHLRQNVPEARLAAHDGAEDVFVEGLFLAAVFFQK